MTQFLDNNLIQLQDHRLTRLGSDHCIDVHSHCLPGQDDGPQDMQDTLCLCHVLVSPFTDLPLAKSVATGAHDTATVVPPVAEVFDMIVQHHGREMAQQLFVTGEPLPLMKAWDAHQLESGNERRD